MTTPDPTTDDHRMLRESLGAFVLDGLGPGEAEGVRIHLAGCAACRAELAVITPSATALAQLRDVPPPDLADRIVERIRAERAAAPVRRIHPPRRGVLVAAAAVVVAAFGAGALGLAVGSAGTPAGTPLAVQAAGQGVDASARLIAHTWGTEITLTAAGLRAGGVYRVVVLDATGRPVDAGAFIGTGAQRMRCNLNSPVRPADAIGFEVLDDVGGVVVSGHV